MHSWPDSLATSHFVLESAQRLNQAFFTAAQNPDVRKALESTGNYLSPARSPADLANLYKQEIERYRAIAKSINLQAQAVQ